MICIHGIGSSVLDYVIYDISIYNQIVNFDILNEHEPDSDERHLALTLNFSMHEIPFEKNYDNKNPLIFKKDKYDIFVKDLNNE
jgi:hypothetical protein